MGRAGAGGGGGGHSGGGHSSSRSSGGPKNIHYNNVTNPLTHWRKNL